MVRSRRPSAQTLKVLDALASNPSVWRYGYELGLEVGLRSGSLYPILVRLCDRELLEAKWEESPPVGRPPRHLYRLTAGGLEHAAASRPTGSARASQPPSARTSGCVIGALFVSALAILAVLALPAILRAIRGAVGHDQARRLLVLAVRGLPPARHDWAQAMLAEFDQVQGRRARWRFSLGCAWAAVRIRVQSRNLAAPACAPSSLDAP